MIWRRLTLGWTGERGKSPQPCPLQEGRVSARHTPDMGPRVCLHSLYPCSARDAHAACLRPRTRHACKLACVADAGRSCCTQLTTTVTFDPARVHASLLVPARLPAAACRSSVLARIEGFVSEAITAIARGELPELQLVSRAAGNTHLVAAGDGLGGSQDAAAPAAASMEQDYDALGASSGGPWGTDAQQGGQQADVWDLAGDDLRHEAAAAAQQQQPDRAAAAGRLRGGGGGGARLRLGTQVQTKSMTFAQGRQAQSVARGAWQVSYSRGEVLSHSAASLVPCTPLV
jgi:hypothetical protein